MTEYIPMDIPKIYNFISTLRNNNLKNELLEYMLIISKMREEVNLKEPGNLKEICKNEKKGKDKLIEIFSRELEIIENDHQIIKNSLNTLK